MRLIWLVVCWLMLASVAPLPAIGAPIATGKGGLALIRPASAACTEQAAVAVITRVVEVQGIPSGRATAWSCVSLDQALAELARQEAQVRADVRTRYGRSDP